MKPDKNIYNGLDPKGARNVIKGTMIDHKIWIDGKKLDPGKSQKIYNHSPNGFCWGYGGSGPAQLALAILLEFTEKRIALALHQAFKWDYVAQWPIDEDFQVQINIVGWIKIKVKTKDNYVLDSL